jgi:hypothetical protein
MENNNCTIVIEVFVCKTKYSIYVVIYVTIPKGDNVGGFGHERNQQIRWNFYNEKCRHPTSIFLHISNENDGHHENDFHTWEMHMQNSSNKYLGEEHSIQLLVVTRP